MISISVITEICAAGVLLSTFLMMGKVRLGQMLRYFIFASIFLAGLGACVTLLKGEDDFLPAIATLVFKAGIIPAIIHFTAKKIPSTNQLKMYVRPATTYVLFVAVMLFAALITARFPWNSTELGETVMMFRSLLFISVSLILSGILLTLLRKDLFSQVLGVLTMENGIAAFALVALDVLPLFLEMGIFFAIIGSTIILAMLIDNVHKGEISVDTSNLNELID